MTSVEPPRVLFIALEGLDGAGTTTQRDLLADALRELGHSVHVTHEPSQGPIGKTIRDILAGAWAPFDERALALLFAADRLDHLTREIEPALASGKVVITDRYTLSSLAYQARKRGLPWITSINAKAREPDLTIFLEVSVDVCMQRLAHRDTTQDIFEREDVLWDVHARYRGVLDDRKDDPRVVRIDGEQSIEAVAAAVYESVFATLTA